MKKPQVSKHQFVIDDGESVPSMTPHVVLKAIDILKSLPDDRLLTTRGLVNRLGVSPSYFNKCHSCCSALMPYKRTYRGKSYFGNSTAIENFVQSLQIS